MSASSIGRSFGWLYLAGYFAHMHARSEIRNGATKQAHMCRIICDTHFVFLVTTCRCPYLHPISWCSHCFPQCSPGLFGSPSCLLRSLLYFYIIVLFLLPPTLHSFFATNADVINWFPPCILVTNPFALLQVDFVETQAKAKVTFLKHSSSFSSVTLFHLHLSGSVT